MKTDIYPRISAVAEYLERNEPTEAIVKEFIAKWNVKERTIKWYITLAKDMVAERREKQKVIIENVRNEAIADAARENILSDLELEAILCSIARGEAREQKIVSRGKVKKVKRSPSFLDSIWAIDRLWRRRGLYKPATNLPNNQAMIIEYKVERPEDITHIENT